METITIDGTIIPLTFDGFHKLSLYEKYVYVKILNIERLYKRYVYNDTTSAIYINICHMIDFGFDEDDDMVLENYLVNTRDRYYNDFCEYEKNHVDNCKCPYQYRTFYINGVMTNSYCKCCQKRRTIDEMKKEDFVKRRKCGLYLASDLSSENILNVLPNDISKYVIQYI
jgi:hypothetical protein